MGQGGGGGGGGDGGECDTLTGCDGSGAGVAVLACDS